MTAKTAWWLLSKSPFKGEFLNELVLGPDHIAHARIQTIRHAMLNAGQPSLSTVRAQLFTEGWRANPTDHPALRKAKGFLNVAKNIAIPLIEEQLLMGTPAAKFNAIEIEIEYATGWMNSQIAHKNITELRYLPHRPFMPVTVSDDDILLLETELFPYWEKRYLGHHILTDISANFPKSLDFATKGNVFWPNFGKGFSHSIQHYRAVVEQGFTGLAKEIKKSMVRADNRNQVAHYEAMLICIEAAIAYAERCAKICETNALDATDTRKKELLMMANTCRNVPANPSRSWHEALQAIHFAHMMTYFCDGGVSHSYGRMDSYLYPFYQKWVENGSETTESAQELLECFFLKCFEYQSIRDHQSAKGLSGDRTNDKITLGGRDAQGNDASTPLTYRFLEAHAHVHLKEPNLSIRMHQNMPKPLSTAALEVVRLGSGLPHLLNDDVITNALVAQTGMSRAAAIEAGDIGCQENNADPNGPEAADANGHNNGGFFNLAKILENTLHGSKFTLEARITRADTPPSSAEDLRQRFRMHLRNALIHYARVNQMSEYHYAHTIPNPWLNLMHPGPRASGVDFVAGGCQYNWLATVGVGLATVADSLHAIDHLVFKCKIVTWKELITALADNWEGHHSLKNKALSLPKYGGGGSKAERWARWVAHTFTEECAQAAITRGGKAIPFVVGYFSMGIHTILGKHVGATPDGRNAHEAVSGSTAPSLLAEHLGHTATHIGAASIETKEAPNGCIFNEVMPLNMVDSPERLNRWNALLTAFFDMGGQSVQYSILDRSTLVDAQKNPENHPDLLVRLGGYSARFIDLSRELQNDFIQRLCKR